MNDGADEKLYRVSVNLNINGCTLTFEPVNIEGPDYAQHVQGDAADLKLSYVFPPGGEAWTVDGHIGNVNFRGNTGDAQSTSMDITVPGGVPARIEMFVKTNANGLAITIMKVEPLAQPIRLAVAVKSLDGSYQYGYFDSGAINVVPATLYIRFKTPQKVTEVTGTREEPDKCLSGKSS